MNAKEILDYTFKFWENRKTLDKTGVYKARHEKILHIDHIFVSTPWGTTHTAIMISNNETIAFFDVDQYHFSGFLDLSKFKDYTKKLFYNMYKKHQRILEHSSKI
jgi:hypothetical protein